MERVLLLLDVTVTTVEHMAKSLDALIERVDRLSERLDAGLRHPD